LFIGVAAVSLAVGLTWALRSWLACRHEGPAGPADQPQAAGDPRARFSGNDKESAAAVRALADEAQRLVADLQRQYPDDHGTQHLEAQLHQRLGEAGAARQLWQACLQSDPQDLEALISLGTIYVESGDHARAEPLLRAALAQAPLDPQASCYLGNVLVHQGKFPDAIEVLHASLAAHPDSLPNQVLLGQAYLQTKAYAEAKQAFLAATQLVPDYANAYHGLATACARLGEQAEAAQYREKLRSLQAKQLGARVDQSHRNEDLKTTRRSIAEVFVAAGQLCHTHGDQRGAQQHWQRAVELDPDSVSGRALLAELYQQQNRPRDVLQVLLPLTATRPTDAGLWLRLGQLHAHVQEFEQAEQALRQVTSLSPQRAVGHAALTQLYLQWQNHQSAALVAAAEAVRLEPTAAHFALLSAAREHSGDPRGALEALEKALQLEPGNGPYQQRYLALRRRI
jgi:predicted Zn-dependent protease